MVCLPLQGCSRRHNRRGQQSVRQLPGAGLATRRRRRRMEGERRERLSCIHLPRSYAKGLALCAHRDAGQCVHGRSLTVAVWMEGRAPVLGLRGAEGPVRLPLLHLDCRVMAPLHLAMQQT